MPRKPAPVDPKVVAARQRLQFYLDTNKLTQSSFAARCGIGQPTVSKFLDGQVKSLTPAVRRMLDFASIDWNTGMESVRGAADNVLLEAALNRVWDGTTAHARLLAGVIEAVGPLLSARPRRA